MDELVEMVALADGVTAGHVASSVGASRYSDGIGLGPRSVVVDHCESADGTDGDAVTIVLIVSVVDTDTVAVVSEVAAVVVGDD